MKEHVKNNLDVFNIWIETNADLQPTNDLLQPIIPEFKKEFPNVNINGCKECLIDMLRWAKSKLKEETKEKKKHE